MAEQFIEDLYWYSETVYELEVIVLEIRECFDTKAVEHLEPVFHKLTEICRRCINDQLELGRELWASVKKISEIDGDLTTIGDEIELKTLPCIRNYISTLADISVDIDEDYSIHSSASGYLTLYFKPGKLYLHSRNNPMYEAFLHIRSTYKTGQSIYYVYGCGMGYEIYQLYKISDSFLHIVLYEPNDIIYNASLSYGVLSKLPDGALERRSFHSVDDFLYQASSDNAGIIIHVPSMHAITRVDEKRKLTAYLIGQNTIRLYDGSLSENRIRNRMLNFPDSEMLLKSNKYPEAVVIAAGPSLSERIELIKKWKNSKLIIAVGTVFRKLLSEGLEPDYVVIIDPTHKMTEQITGLEESNIPLLLDENAYWKLGRMYKGPVYFMNNMDYGGTVSSAAIEIAIKTNVNKIYLTGLDLGYPILQSHAEGSNGMHELDKTKLFPAECMDGGKVLTDIHLKSYTRIIEKQIADHPDIIFFNLSKHGAKIEGTVLYD